MKGKRVMSRLAMLFAAVLLLLQCASGTRPVEGIASAAPELTDLSSVNPLKQVFQRDRGTVRLVSLLSPV